jgi:hypothetical protein
LICFLVDRGVESLRNARKWQEVVTRVRKHLHTTGNEVRLPIVAHLLARTR